MNLPNTLTLGRIFLVPLLVVVLLTSFDGKSVLGVSNEMLGAAIFALASITDWLDGYLARRRGQVTGLGEWMDPLADKLLITAALISLVQLGRAPAWMVAVILGREFAVTGLRQVALLEGKVLAASRWGKWKTGVQITMIIALLLNNFPFALVSIPFDIVMTWVAAVITVYSGIDYFVKNKNLIPVQ